MAQPRVTLQLEDGSTHTLAPGDLIGRMWSAALRIDHPRISEAHAMVSLRGEQLQLLRLRGGLWVDDRPVTEADLDPGLRVRLCQDVVLDVVDVELPSELLSLVPDHGGPVPLTGTVYSLATTDGDAIVARYVAGAAAYIWTTSTGLALARTGEPARLLAAGDTLTVGAFGFRVCSVPIEDAVGPATQFPGNVWLPMRIRARYDVVEIHVPGRPPVELHGVCAKIVSELVSVGGMESSDAVASAVCGAGRPDPVQLRKRLDKNLWTLRRKLEQAHLRPDLVRATGTGFLQLSLQDGDEVVDET
jgi:hypothetical protein